MINYIASSVDKNLETRMANNRRVYQCGPHQYPILFGYSNYESVPPAACRCYCDTPAGDCLNDVTITSSKLGQIGMLKSYISGNNTIGVISILNSDRTYYNNLIGRATIVDSIINGSYKLRFADSDSTGLTLFNVVNGGNIVVATPCIL